MNTWKAADAKRHFSQVLEGLATAPQILLLRGKPVGVVVAYEDFLTSQRLVGEKGLSSWLDDLKALHEEEGDMELPPRVDRPDTSGEAWN